MRDGDEIASVNIDRLLVFTDNAVYSGSIREDTAELAHMALSETNSARSRSPPRHRLSHSRTEHYDQDGGHGTSWHEEAIPEVSEPTSPVSAADKRASMSSGIGEMLRAFPAIADETKSGHLTPVLNGHGDKGAKCYSDDTQHASEQTPLLGKPCIYTPPPESLADSDDVEGQCRHWRHEPKTLMSRTRTRTFELAKTVASPSQWNKEALWKYGVHDPIKYFPPAVLGTLLNILDSLSFGMVIWPDWHPQLTIQA